jgi:hypothetical protein
MSVRRRHEKSIKIVTKRPLKTKKNKQKQKKKEGKKKPLPATKEYLSV